MAVNPAASVDLVGHPVGISPLDGGHAQAASAVSWGAILAGAAGGAALAMILLLLGLGLGLSSISPWSQRGIGAAAFGVSTIVWVTVTQLLSSGMGGYLAGRLRTKWVAVHADEAYFRDTAHGFLSWAVATLATAALLGSVLSAVVGTGVQAGASVAGGVTAAAGAAAGGAVRMAGDQADSTSSSDPLSYFIDSLFRRSSGVPSGAATPEAAASASSTPASAPAAGADAGTTADAGTAATPQTPPIASAGPSQGDTAATVSEVSRIFLNSAASGKLPEEDQRYVAQLVAQRTGLSQAEAEQRVSQTYARMQARVQEAATTAREAADKARKATVYATLWLFVSLLAGAFFASFAATLGGRQRDL